MKSVTIPQTQESVALERTQTIWGMDAVALHRAYWAARGVQPIARGSQCDVDRQAELYLLIEPDQLVMFDLRRITDRMTWNGARLTRVRVVQEEEARYRERVLINDLGDVERIERYYRPHPEVSYRVLITRHRRIARTWSSALRRTDAWREARRIIPYYQIDHCRRRGACFDALIPADQGRLMNMLVAAFSDPSRAIEGIAEVSDGVWARRGYSVPDDVIAIGPVWIGDNSRIDGDIIIGPAWIADGPRDVDTDAVAQELPLPAARVRPIARIEPSHARQSESEFDDIRAFHEGPFSIKRIFDLLMSATILTVSLPLLLIVAVAIVIDDGWPLFFGHVRQTRGGRLFRCWKFRTMRRNAEQMVPQLAAKNLSDGPHVNIENDPRVTRVGRLLRKLHIDELPQFYNVLRGDMSIVGPRPSPDKENQFCPAWREMRLSVRPGITGLWQVERTRQPGRDFQEWIRYDMEYVRRQSFLLDLSIIARTAINIVFGRSDDASDEKR
ncbi:MAG: sugar transferase [Phycisphaerales bacterium]